MIEYLSPRRFERNGHPDEEFIVTWEVAVSAQNFVDAAAQAQALHRSPECTASCYAVTKAGTREAKIVDFGEESTLENPDQPDPAD